MVPDPVLLAIGVTAVMISGISKGGFGSGAGVASVALLALVFEPRAALAVMMPLLLLIDAVALKGFWRRWHGPSMVALILGGVPGVLLGALLSDHASPDALRLLIGGLALAFVAWQMSLWAGWLRFPPMPFRWDAGLITGVLGGFTSFVSHAGGPAVAVFLLGQNLDKTRYHATTVATFSVINVIKAVIYGLLGFFTVETLWLDVWLAPVALVAAWIGVRAHHLVPERPFFAITYGLLVVTGGKLVWDGLT